MGLFVVTAALVLVTLIGPHVHRWWYRPVLHVRFSRGPPDSHMTHLVNRANDDRARCCYFRIWVENTGRSSAKDVEVFAAELSRLSEDGGERVDRFLPINLLLISGGNDN